MTPEEQGKQMDDAIGFLQKIKKRKEEEHGNVHNSQTANTTWTGHETTSNWIQESGREAF